MIQVPDPQTKSWRQANNSDLFGNIAFSKNITLDKQGYVRLSYSSRAAITEDVDVDVKLPMVILRSQDYGYFSMTIGEAFQIDDTKILGVRPTQIATAGVPSGDLQSDSVFNGGLQIVTQDNDVDYYDPAANTWTDTNITLTATQGSQHPVVNFASLASYAIADVKSVKLYNSPITATPVAVATLTILADFYITSMCYFNQNLYIGTMNRFGGHAMLYVWNGYGSAAQSAYEVDSNIIYDVCVHKDSVVCVTGAGQLLRFNGAGFTELDNFPIYYTDRSIADETNINMFHNCLKSNGNLLYINFSGRANHLKLLNQPDGIWCYDSNLGFLYHRYSLSNALVLIDSIATGDVVPATDKITVAAAPITGTECIFNAQGVTPPVPLIDGKKYYVIKIDATHIQLATTKANALAGTPIDITAIASGTTGIVSFPNTDWGQFIIDRVGGLCVLDRIIEEPQYGTDLIWGGSMYSRTESSSFDVIGTVSSAVENRGYIVTPKIFSQEDKDTYNWITLKFSKFLTENDAFVIKYRHVDDRMDEISLLDSTRWGATWTSTTTFTTTETEFANAVVGNEIEFLRGAASGMLAHIVSIPAPVAGVYTVTIDEPFAYYTAGDTSRCVFRNWIKWKTIAYGDKHALAGFMAAQLGTNGKFVQFKIELRGVQTTIEELLIDNGTKLPAKKSAG